MAKKKKKSPEIPETPEFRQPPYLQNIQSLPDCKYILPKVIPIETYRQSHRVTPDTFSLTSPEVAEMALREEIEHPFNKPEPPK